MAKGEAAQARLDEIEGELAALTAHGDVLVGAHTMLSYELGEVATRVRMLHQEGRALHHHLHHGGGIDKPTEELVVLGCDADGNRVRLEDMPQPVRAALGQALESLREQVVDTELSSTDMDRLVAFCELTTED